MPCGYHQIFNYRATTKFLVLQGQPVQNEFLETFHRRLKVSHGQRFVVAVRHEDSSRAVQVPRVVTLKEMDIRSVVGYEGVKA